MTSQEMAAALQGAHDGAGGGILSLGSGANQDPFPAWVGVKFPPSASWKAVPKVDHLEGKDGGWRKWWEGAELFESHVSTLEAALAISPGVPCAAEMMLVTPTQMY